MRFRTTTLLTALGALGLILLAQPAAVGQVPPTGLHLVGDHWTPWDPPTSFPEGAEIYTIVSGDTLWDLAGRFYGDPYLWPQLWERNQYILDAHWIYPGDPLVIGIEVIPVEQIAEVEPEVVEESMFDEASGGPVPLGSEADMYCTGFVGDVDQAFSLQVSGSEYQSLAPQLTYERASTVGIGTTKLGLTVGDIVYLDGGAEAGLEVASTYMAVGRGDIVRSPRTNEVVGRLYRYLGRVRVLSTQQTSAIAEIVHSCHPIEIGDYLQAFEPTPVPLGRISGMHGYNEVPPAGLLDDAPTIVLSEAGIVSMGQDHLVYIDRGDADDVAPGDIFTIYREAPAGPMVVGELAVLSTRENTALGRILASRHTIFVGDRLSPKG